MRVCAVNSTKNVRLCLPAGRAVSGSFGQNADCVNGQDWDTHEGNFPGMQCAHVRRAQSLIDEAKNIGT